MQIARIWRHQIGNFDEKYRFVSLNFFFQRFEYLHFSVPTALVWSLDYSHKIIYFGCLKAFLFLGSTGCLIFQAADWNYKDPIISPISKFCSSDYQKQIRFHEWRLDAFIVVLMNKAFYFSQMQACLFNLMASQLKFDKGISAVTQMENAICFKIIPVMVV